MKTKFLYHPKHKEVFALFPEEIADPQKNMLCYVHIGQHSSCCKEYADECRQATKEEYKDLLNELVNLVGYDDLEIVNEVKNIKELPITLDQLYNGEKQIKIKLSESIYQYDLVLLDSRKKIDCKISSFAANLYTRTVKGMSYKKYNSIADLQREVKKQINRHIENVGNITFMLSNEVHTI